MENKKIVQQFIENLVNNKEKAYEIFAENVKASWPGSGMKQIEGKEKLLKFFTDNGHNEIISQKTENLLEDGDNVFGNGNILTEKNGVQSKACFADLYRLKDGKIVELTSYVLMEK